MQTTQDLIQKTQDRLTQALDEALEMTFPASDPIAVTLPESARLAVALSTVEAGDNRD